MKQVIVGFVAAAWIVVGCFDPSSIRAVSNQSSEPFVLVYQSDADWEPDSELAYGLPRGFRIEPGEAGFGLDQPDVGWRGTMTVMDASCEVRSTVHIDQDRTFVTITEGGAARMSHDDDIPERGQHSLAETSQCVPPA